jgi:hypothetical protein
VSRRNYRREWDEPTQCGSSCTTGAGAALHRRRGERPCETARAARTAYLQDYRQRRGADVRRTEQVNQRARRRAHVRLAEAHPAEFERLLAEEQVVVGLEMLREGR